MKTWQISLGFTGAAAILLALAPTLSSYWQTVILLLLLNTLLILSYRLITTMGGWSFAHVSIMGLGAYTLAILTTMENAWPFWLAALASIAVTGVFSLALAYPVLRTRAYYFFLSTFAASEALRQCFIQFPGLTGGTNGIAFIPRPGPVLGLSFTSTFGFLGLVVVVTLIVGLILLHIDHSRTGRVVKAVAENEDLSVSLGVNAWAYRSFAFVIGSMVAGLAGALMASFNGAINPSDFTATTMFKLVAAAIVGGTTTFSGPILGLLLLTAIEEIFRDQASWVPLFWGLAVLGAVLFSDRGLEGFFDGRRRT